MFLAGISLGLVSSFHCVGMCGPLALALPVQYLDKSHQVKGYFLYNSGRVITYSVLGLVMGLAGRRLYLAGWQQDFSIVSGIIILVMLFKTYLLPATIRQYMSNAFVKPLMNLIWRLMSIRKLYACFLLGMANGLLPCGMVYFALITAINGTSLLAAVGFMFLFGLGTLPAMLALSLSGLKLGLNARIQMKRVIPYVIASMAVVLILRGMNLGIPFISPHISPVAGHGISCEE